MKRNLIFTILLIILVSYPGKTLASEFPQVTGGPGLILPDSPFYALDKLYQKGKLFLAIEPQKRAEVRNGIMGERMAELRVSYEKGDRTAMGLAMLELTEEARKIESDLKEAEVRGVDVSATAKTISDSIRFYRKVLSEASNSSDDDIASALESSSQSLLTSKVVIEGFLRPEDLADAVQNDIDDEGETAVLGVQRKAERLERRFDALEKKADRENALEDRKLKAEGQIKERELREKRRQLIFKRKQLIAERKKKISEAKEALKRVREAAKGFVNIKTQEKSLESSE